MQEILTLEDAAKLLRVSSETVRRKAQRGDLPATKVGREWRFSRRQLMNWLEERAAARESAQQRSLGV